MTQAQKKSICSQGCMLVLLAALLCVPAVIRQFSGIARADSGRGGDGTTATAPTVDVAAAKARYGFALRDVAAEAGIDFVHQAPKLDAKLDHIMPQVASMGAAVSVCDFDRDGWQDLYFANSGEGSLNRLYRNKGDGTFEDVAAAIGVADVNQRGTGVSMGSVWADYDNDGYEDLLVYKWGRPELFRNEGGKRFTRVTDTARALPKWVNANSAIWFDYDVDGNVDLFLAGYWRDDLDLWNLADTKMMCESFEYADNGGSKFLLRNNGDGTFTDVTAAMGIRSTRWTLAAAAGDLRGTGYPDLFLANDYGVSELFVNDRGRGFRQVGEETGVGKYPKSGMSVSFGDVNNEGAFAIYKTNISEEGVLLQGNDLWVPDGRTRDGLPKYRNLGREAGLEVGGWSWGAQFADFNNDGWQDLFCTNGYISLDRQKSYWYDFSKIAGANNAIIIDAKNWPPQQDRSLSGYQRKKLWVNDGAGRFAEVAQAVGATDLFDGRGVATADLFNRGALDLVIANQRGPVKLYRNDADARNAWIAFDLTGTRSNRSAIGAQVRVFFAGMQQLQEVSGGSGFSAQNGRRLHFGLGKDAAVERVEIRWPSGATQTIEGPEINKLHAVKEPE